MNFEHEQLMDNLKGHTYQIKTPWHYQDIREHMDNEMYWIMCSIGDSIAKRMKEFPNKKFYTGDLFVEIAEGCYKVICDREGLEKTTHNDIDLVKDHINKAYAKFNGQKSNNIQELIDTFWMYAVEGALAVVRFRKL